MVLSGKKAILDEKRAFLVSVRGKGRVGAFLRGKVNFGEKKVVLECVLRDKVGIWGFSEAKRGFEWKKGGFGVEKIFLRCEREMRSFEEVLRVKMFF